jgi:hypothetical protein
LALFIAAKKPSILYLKISMKKILSILVLMMIPIIGSFTKGIDFKVRRIAPKKEISCVLETLTVYNPVVRQCDSTPLITANNAKIDPDKLYKQELRWLALSRHLLKRWKGEFNYGDTVKLTAGDADIDGLWVIQDTLNKRFKNRGDLLFDSRVRKLGKWSNVKITLVSHKSDEKLTEVTSIASL